MKNNRIKFATFFISLGVVLVASMALTNFYHSHLQAAALEPSVLSIPEAPPLPYTLEEVQKEQDEKIMEGRRKRESIYQKAEDAQLDVLEREQKMQSEKQRSTQTLLCFLDDSEIYREDKNFLVSLELMVAIGGKLGPIVASSSLLANIFNKNGNHDAALRGAVLALYNEFDSRQWVIKKITSDFCLLFPKKDFSEDEIKQIIFDTSEENEITPLEYRLGLKVNHMKTLPLDTTFFAAQKWFEEKYDSYRKKAQSKNLQSAVRFAVSILENKLLVPINYQDEKNDISDLLPEINVYIVGHGNYGRSIAGIPIFVDDKKNKFTRTLFQRMLDYFATKTKTKLVVISSCYAAGFNSQKVLSELKGGGSTIIYPFHLVVLATGDAATTIGKFIGFDTFIQEAKKNLENIEMVKRAILPLMPELKADVIPQWRPAKSALWIPLSEDDRAVVRVGKVKAAQMKKSIEQGGDYWFRIDSYKDAQGNRQDPQMILLAAKNMPFGFDIDPAIKKIPAFLSVTPGSMHKIDALSYRGAEFNVNDFCGDINYAYNKEFFIKDLFTIRDGKKELFSNVIISKEKDLIVAFGFDGFDRKYYFNAYDTLWAAIKKGNETFLINEILSQMSAEDINKINKTVGYTLLTHVVMSNSPDEVYQALIDKGASAFIENDQEHTTFNKINENGTANQLEQIFRLEKPEMVRQFINQTIGYYRDTPLHIAVYDKKNGLEKVKLLLKYGADPSLKNDLGKTSLDNAQREFHGNAEIADVLMKYNFLKEKLLVESAI